MDTIAELRAEIERYAGEVKALHETIGEIDRQHAAEIERLRAELDDARNRNNRYDRR